MKPRHLPAGVLLVREVAERSGYSPSVLRVWEERYGWPSPQRLPNGYRAFAPNVLVQLAEVRRWMQQGFGISDIIRDGFPRAPIAAPAAPRALADDALPPLPYARPLWEQLRAALRQRRVGDVLSVLHALPIHVRPTSRPAFRDLVAASLADWRAQGRPLPSEAEVARVAGVDLAQLPASPLQPAPALPVAIDLAPLPRRPRTITEGIRAAARANAAKARAAHAAKRAARKSACATESPSILPSCAAPPETSTPSPACSSTATEQPPEPCAPPPVAYAPPLVERLAVLLADAPRTALGCANVLGVPLDDVRAALASSARFRRVCAGGVERWSARSR